MKKKRISRFRYFWQSFTLTLTAILCIGGLLIVQYNTQLISIGAAATKNSYMPMPSRLNLSFLSNPPSAVSETIIKMGALLPAPCRLIWEGAEGVAYLLNKLDSIFSNQA